MLVDPISCDSGENAYDKVENLTILLTPRFSQRQSFKLLEYLPYSIVLKF